MKSIVNGVVPCLGALVALVSSVGAAELTVLPANRVFFNLTAISDDGSTVVGTVFDGGERAAYWTEAEGVVVIGNGSAHNCSADGSVIVGNMSGNGFEDVWGGPAPSLPVPVSNVNFSGAYDINPDGSVIVGNFGYSSGGDTIICACRWEGTNAAQVLACVTNGTWCNATGVDATGDIVCGFNEDDAFLWSVQSGYQVLPFLEGQMIPYYMSSDGNQIVGSFGEVGNGVFRWDASTGMTVLVDDHDVENPITILSLSPDGGVATAPGPEGISRSLIWDSRNVRRTVRDVLVHEHGLPLEDWSMLTVQGVSARGLAVCGYGQDPTGFSRTWVAQLDHPLGTTRLRIEAGSPVAIAWLGATGETYGVEARDPVTGADWEVLDSRPGMEGVIQVQVSEATSHPARHYRLVKTPAP